MNTTEKIFVIDTNIILNDHTVPFMLKNSRVVIPQIVIQELDKKRDFIDNKTAGFNARSFCRKIRKLIKEQGGCELQSGTVTLVLLPADIAQTEKDIKKLGLDPSKADSHIVATAWRLKEAGGDVTLLTNDTNMWVSSTALGIHVEDYEVNRMLQDVYSGVKTIELEDTTPIDAVYMGEEVLLTEEEHPGLYPNQILVLKCKNGLSASLIAMFEGYNRPIRRLRDMKKMSFAGIRPLNKEQSFAFELLSDRKISCFTLAGRAGTGKSMVALSYAIENLRMSDGGVFDKIIILKPVVPVGRDLGFLPGTLEEKLLPWMESFKDSLDLIFRTEANSSGQASKDRSYDYLVESGILEFQPLTFMRGRSIQNTLIILDEAQNTSIHEMKTLMTRIGDGSKIIALGDIEQIDAPWLDQQNNGLAYLIERGKESELLAHITFIKSHRSALADWASSNL